MSQLHPLNMSVLCTWCKISRLSAKSSKIAVRLSCSSLDGGGCDSRPHNMELTGIPGLHVCPAVCVCACMPFSWFVCIYVCVCVCMCLSPGLCVGGCLCLGMCVCFCLALCVFVLLCVYVCVPLSCFVCVLLSCYVYLCLCPDLSVCPYASVLVCHMHVPLSWFACVCVYLCLWFWQRDCPSPLHKHESSPGCLGHSTNWQSSSSS